MEFINSLNYKQTLVNNGAIIPEERPIEIHLNEIKGPYSTRAVLERKAQYYIVPNGDKFYYFKIGEVTRKGEHLFQIDGKKPPILREGLVVINKEVYHVSAEDLIRNVIRKSRKLALKRGPITVGDLLDGNAYIKSNTKTESIVSPTETKEHSEKASKERSTRDPEKTSRVANPEISDFAIEKFFINNGNKEQSRADGDPWLAELESADMAFKEEIGALFHHIAEKEGESWEDWEIEKGT